MTDTTGFARQAIAAVTAFTNAYEDMLLLADMIAADSSLSSGSAAAAAKNPINRPDLTTASFDNFRAAVNVLQTFLNSNNAGVNTATVKLAFYQMR